MEQKRMERRAFLSSVAAAAGVPFAVGGARGQADEPAVGAGEDDEAGGWNFLPYDVKRRRADPDGARLPDGLTAVEELWEFGADGASVPVTSGGTVYFGTSEGVKAVDALTGEEVWGYETERAVEVPPAFHSGTVYGGTAGGRFFAVDARTGDEEWSVGLEGAVTTSPVIDAVDVFVGTESYVYSLDIGDGTENWSFGTRVPAEAAPAVTEERVVFVDGALVFGLDRFEGGREWRSYAGGVLTDVVIGETRVYTVGGGTVYAQRLRNGVDRWSKTVRGDIVGGPVLSGGSLYVATDSGFLYSLDLNSDGFTEWNKEFTGGFVGSPVLVDGVLYGATLDGSEGRLYAVSPSDGATLGEYIIGSEQVEQDDDDVIEGIDVELTDGPIVAGANAYLASEDGLRAFGDEEEVPPTASFEVSPRPPPVGEIITFDASGSSSGSAPIDGYRWSLRSAEEEFGASGEVYEEEFTEARDWTVSLTVTDEDGQSDTVTREVSVGGESSGGGNATSGGRVEATANTTVPTPDGAPGFLGQIDDGVLLALGAIGAIASALGFSAYWRMEPEREKLRRRTESGGLCPDCGASVGSDEEVCGVCGSRAGTQKE